MEHIFLPASAEGTRDAGSIPESGRSPGVENGNPLQYSCLEHPMHGGAWQSTIHGIAESDTTEELSTCNVGQSPAFPLPSLALTYLPSPKAH